MSDSIVAVVLIHAFVYAILLVTPFPYNIVASLVVVWCGVAAIQRNAKDGEPFE